MEKHKKTNRQRQRRRWRVRKRLRGSADRPRLSVTRSLKHIGVQVVDDETGKTLASASSQEKEISASVKYGGNCDAAAAVGREIAQRAAAAGIKAVCFDRGSYKYHGRVAALADAAREGGLQF